MALKNISIAPDVANRVYIKDYQPGFDSGGFSNVNNRYRFDDDGFSKANNEALLAAKQQMQETTLSLWQDIVQLYHPGAYEQSVNGADNAPIDFPEFKVNA